MINVYLIHTITLLPFAGRDKWGNITPPTPQTIRARVEYRTRLMRNPAGEEVSSPVQVLLRPDQAITHEDRVILSDNSERPILDIAEKVDFGLKFKEVSLGQIIFD